MGIEAGKFFVSLGLTGAEKTVSGLAQVNDHFAGLKGISTEAKLAILGALAGLEQMVSVSGKFGNETMKTHQHLMVSIHDLQLYEAMAQRAGAAVGSMTSMFENVQNAMESLKLEGKTSPFMPVLMALMQGNGTKMSPDQIVQWGSKLGGPVQFAEELLRLQRNYKGKADINFMLQQSGLMPQDIFDVNSMGAFGKQARKIAEGEIVSDVTIKKMNQLNQSWKDFELESIKIMHLFSEGLVPIVEKLANVSKTIADAFSDLRRDVDAMEPTPSDIRHGKEMDYIFYKLNPSVAALVKNHGMKGATMSWGDINVNISGVDLSNHSQIKKVVKSAIGEAMGQQRKSTIGKTPTSSMGQ